MMARLSVSDAAHIAGVPWHTIYDQIENGELTRTDDGIALDELIRVYPNLKPLANLKLRKVKQSAGQVNVLEKEVIRAKSVTNRQQSADKHNSAHKVRPATAAHTAHIDIAVDDTSFATASHAVSTSKSENKTNADGSADTVQLLVRELEWNKELLEQTNKLMARQLEEQRALIADQARRLDDKDRFWARQIEIAQSLLPAPEPQRRKKLFGLF